VQRHRRIGLSPSWYIGGCHVVLNRLVAIALRVPGWDLPTIQSVVTAINSAVMLDMDIAVAAHMTGLEQMAKGLAHDLNQPIGIMALAAENAARGLEQKGGDAIPFALRRLERIVDQAARLKSIVDDFRTVDTATADH
jgi:signal transduction histidine kinase